MDMSTGHFVVLLILVGFSSKALGNAPVLSCDFEDPSICNFVQDTKDDFNWTRTSGSTPSSNTGPLVDHTYGTSQGHYMYIEATNQNTNDTARLWTPPYSATSGLCIEWFYHMYGDTVNTLNVYVVDTTGTVGAPVWTKTNKQGQIWIPGKVSVEVFGIYQIMFEGIRGSSYTSDIALDDVKISYRTCSKQDTSQCDFEHPSICNFVQDTKDDFNWTRTSGSTPSSKTGPSVDHTHGTSQGHYMYIEATNQNTNDTARLWTPPYPATDGLCIEWFYHMYGDTVNTLNVYVVDSTGTVGAPVWTKTNKQGQMWIPGKVSVAVFGVYQIMFEGIRGSSYTSDIALDDVKISYRTCSKQDASQCDFEDPSICNFVQDTMDDFHWTRRSASTPSKSTGPSFDHTYGSSQGYYMYIEATSQSTNDTARLWTPSYPATNGLCIEWFYHMYGETVNTLNVYVVDSTGTVGTPVWSKTNHQGNIWILGQVSFVAAFGVYQIMFEGIRGSDFTSDIGLDDVTITNGACLTQGPTPAFALCDFEDRSICNFVQDTMDDFDWTRMSASTPSSNTGPSFDHTYRTSQGYYMYIEATSQSNNDIARLWTPSYPATNGMCIEWFYHMYGDSVNTLNVYVVDSTGNVGLPVWTRTNNQGNLWILGQVSVTASGIYQIMFEGIRGNDFTGDISLDDVKINSGACLTQGKEVVESTTVVSTTQQSTTVESTTVASDAKQSTTDESTTVVSTTQQSTADESTLVSFIQQKISTHQLTSMESTPIQSADALKSESPGNGLLVGIFTGIAIGIVFTSSVCIIIWKTRNSTSKERGRIENEDKAGIYMTHIEWTKKNQTSEDLMGNAYLIGNEDLAGNDD